MRSEKLLQAYLEKTVENVVEFMGGDLSASTAAFMSMAVALMLGAYQGNREAAANHIEALAEGIAGELRKESDTRDFRVKH